VEEDEYPVITWNMSSRRVVLSESRVAGGSTLNDRFRQIQEANKERRSETRRKVTRAIPTRSVSMSRPVSRGVSKPTSRGGRGVLRSESNGRISRGRGGRRSSNGSKGKEGNKFLKTTSTRGRGGRGGRGRGGRGTRGGRGGKVLSDKGEEKKGVTKEDLDKEMDSYMLKDAKKGKDLLDTELDEYMSHRGVQATIEEIDKETQPPDE